MDMLINGVDDSEVVVLDSGAEVNYLASGALKDSGVILTSTDIRLFRVDRTPLDGAVKGVLSTVVKWGEVSFSSIIRGCRR
jgi:hypothetical protein